MGLPAQLTRRAARLDARRRAGAAIASALFALTAAAMLTASVHWMTRVDVRTTTNRESALRALTIAEAGVSHALWIMRDTLAEYSYTEFLRGPDTTNAVTTDDGYLIGRTLSAANDIPVSGRSYAGGRYAVRIVDDPADADANATRDQNSRVLVTCTGYGPDGARAQLDVVVGGITLPGFVFDGPLTISGSAQALGRCGGVHANGPITIGGTLVTSGPVSSTSTVIGAITDPTGTAVAPLTHGPKVDMPPIDVAALCASARYYMASNGDVFDRTISNAIPIGNGVAMPLFGFKRASGPPETKWSWEPIGTVDGSFCFEGNVEISGNPGSAATPRRWSIYTPTGSVSVSGNPYLRSFDADSMLIASGGDVMVSGNPTGGGISYGGAIYARHQCQVNGNPLMNGQMICDNEPGQPTSSVSELVASSNISGNPRLAYNCNNKYASTRRIMAWIQVPGT